MGAEETIQWASKIYESRFGSDGRVNEDINKLTKIVPVHDLLVGGFPCQDYSVARTISQSWELKEERKVVDTNQANN